MYLKCLIVDNEPVQAELLKEIITSFSRENGHDIQCDIHYHFPEVVDVVQKYDICFLDILLDGQVNGIEIAQKIRNQNYKNEIVFVTGYKEYALDGYEVNALDYLLKPVNPQKLHSCLKRVLEKNRNSFFQIHCKKGIYHYCSADILYIESSEHSVIIHKTQLLDRIPISFHQISETIPDMFIQIHRTILVNLDHVRKVYGHELILDNEESLPIGRKYGSAFKKVMLDYYVRESWTK